VYTSTQKAVLAPDQDGEWSTSTEETSNYEYSDTGENIKFPSKPYLIHFLKTPKK
jgi:hypothetical protein